MATCGDLGLGWLLVRISYGKLGRSRRKIKETQPNEKDVGNSPFFYSAATEVEIDKQGRINLPQTLLTDYAKIDKECRVIGVSDRIEIWSSERWDEFVGDAEENYEAIAEGMMDFDL